MEEFTKHYNDQLISTMQKCIETMEEQIELFELIKKLRSDKEMLQVLNKKLSERFIENKTE